MSNPRAILYKVIENAKKEYHNRYVYSKIELERFEAVLKRQEELSKKESSLQSTKNIMHYYEREIEVSKYLIKKGFEHFNKTKRVMLEKGFDVSDIQFDLIDKTIFE